MANKKYQLEQSIKQELKNKYDFEERKVDAHLEEIRARKIQLTQQMKDRLQNKISS